MDYLEQLPVHLDRTSINNLRRTRQRWANQPKKGFLRYRHPCEELTHFRAGTVECSSPVVRLGDGAELDDQQRAQVNQGLQAFIPWRKGPFTVFGIELDAEWRSDRKWARLQPFLPDLKDAVIADIGCSNGYYMFRMAPHRPRLVIGFEPSVQHYYCFKALNAIAGFENLHIDLLGVEHLGLFPESFEVIFLMGVIYHRPSPIDALREVHGALTPGGTLILESQAIPGIEPVALFPEKTYAKVPGTYFVPTATCLHHWLLRAGFSEVEQFCCHPMSSEEQRRTDWMRFESYADFIDPERPGLTLEGYPAPWRVFFKAGKKERT